MNREQAKELIEKYNNGLVNEEEKRWVENWYLDQSRKHVWTAEQMDFLHLKEEILNGTLKKSGLGLKSVVSRRLNIWPRIAVAAVILIAFGIGLYTYNIDDQQTKGHQVAENIEPGGNKAILTLANGERVILNDAADGEISRLSGISVRKTNDGELIYSVVAGAEKLEENTKNTISTPKGGQYTIILSDGTKVILNSASSLTFPTVFKQKERFVELNGEAYFEVARNKDKHFKVVSGIQTVEVLGTHFNVNAYTDEERIKTTLLEGSVKVYTATNYTLIEPGEQAVLSKKEGNSIAKRRVSLSKETAWINGVFSFEGDDLKSVMRQISRWYDVDVEYEGVLNEEKYYGEISRNSKLSEVFKILELNNVHFDVVGKTVRVSYNQSSSTKIKP